jgi:hypothetical protein
MFRHARFSPFRTALLASLALAPLMALACASIARADDTPAAPPANWADTIAFSGHVEGGMSFNAADKTGSEMIGDVNNDKANQFMLNQAMLTVERPIDSTSSDVDFGFRLQGLFGTDARLTHGFNEMDHLIRDREQLDIVEGTVSAHLPVLTSGGVDIKAGQFPTPMGAEVIDATGNYFYSHSYIYNYGIPLKQTGVLTTTHINPLLDLYAGWDTGVNAFAGNGGYNNNVVKGQFGFGLNMLGGDLSVLGFTHIGAEDPESAGLPHNALRYLNDITTTWKVNPDWTLVNDANYIQDDGLRAIGYGMAQYAVYKINDHWSLAARAELWRDNAGAFVAAFPGNFDYVNSERGLAYNYIPVPRTTYGELTIGATYKPAVPKAIDGLMIRPELRYDTSLNNTRAFDINGANLPQDKRSFTPAVDFILPF